MKYPQYENYKDSRLNWLETIPENWEVKRIKFISKIFGRIGFRGYNADDLVGPGEGAITLGAGQIDKNDKIDLSSPVYLSWEKYEESPEIKVRKGDIIFGQRGSIGKVAYIDKEYGKVTINPSLILLKDIKLNPIYLTFFLQSPLIRKWVQLIGNSTAVPMISQEQFANFPCLIPPTEEQQFIANFLDKETARLDALITKKQQLIETLKEKRIAVISHAVTKGLNPEVPTKESGIEWLDLIPKDWKEKPLKFVCTLNDETLPETTDPEYEIKYVDIGSIDQNKGIIKKEPYIFDEAPSRARRKVIHGDIIVSTVRTYLRAIAPVINPEENLIVSTGFAVIRPRRIASDYLSFLLRSKYFVEKVVSLSVGVSYPAINASVLGSIKIPIPSEDEQRQISTYLYQETQNIDNLIGLTEKHIDKLIEYKTALISAAVTGKIKVPEQA